MMMNGLMLERLKICSHVVNAPTKGAKVCSCLRYLNERVRVRNH